MSSRVVKSLNVSSICFTVVSARPGAGEISILAACKRDGDSDPAQPGAGAVLQMAYAEQMGMLAACETSRSVQMRCTEAAARTLIDDQVVGLPPQVHIADAGKQEARHRVLQCTVT